MTQALRALAVWLMVLATTGVLAAQTSNGQRAEISLEGQWQRVVLPVSVDYPAGDARWDTLTIPGTTWVSPEGGAKSIWHQRQIEIPASAKGGRVFVDIRAARYRPVVYIDRQRIGGGSDGWSPTLVEITDAVTPGQTHTLAIRLYDRGAFFVEGFVLERGMSDEQTRGKTLAPFGGYKDSVGIADRVLLRITPAVYVDQDELVITTSVRKQALTIGGVVQGGAGHAVRAEVVEGDRVVLSADAKADGDGRFQIHAPFPDARLWSPEDPHLYHVRVSVRDEGNVVDTWQQRFGFREIWTDGPDFYLNGVKRHLLGTSTWPVQQVETPERIREKVQGILESNANTFRPHIGLWQEAWLDAADEAGLLIIDESALYTDGSGLYAYTDPRFWENMQQHIAGMIRRDRNRPSVIMWSLGNEILFMGMQRYDSELPKKLGDLARFARTVDDTRPLTFEADLDPDNAYDVIGLHYPREMPQHREYPNTADWLGTRTDTEAGGGMLGQQGTRGFFWDREKPLYIGEYLWTPHGDYSCSTIWFGDEAFLNRDRYHDLSRVRAWVDQTIAYRKSGVSGMCPWTALEFGAVARPESPGYQAQQNFYRHIAAYLRNRSNRFYSGTETKLAFDVMNDSATPQKLELRLEGNGIDARAEVELEPAGHRVVEIPVTWPTVDRQRQLELTFDLIAGGQMLRSEGMRVRIYPTWSLQAPAGFEVLVYDPSGKWPNAVQTLDALANAEIGKTILLVTENVVPAPTGERTTIGRLPANLGSIRQWLERGGRAVILEQADLGAFGLGLQTADRASTMAFPLSMDHPILRGMRAEDLKWWAPDNYVTRREVVRPTAGGARALAVTGGTDWLRHAPILELPLGDGFAVIVQMLAGERRAIEPAAGELINRALARVATERPAADPPQVVGSSEAFAPLGVSTTATSDRFLFLAGGGEDVVAASEQARRILSAGGTVYWHAPTPDSFARLRESLAAPGLRVRETTLGISLPVQKPALLHGVSREDVTRTTPARGWDRKMQFIPTAARLLLEDDTQRTWQAANRANWVRDGAPQTGFTLEIETPGVFAIQVAAQANTAPAALIVNDVEVAWFTPSATPVELQAQLQQGENRIWLTVADAPQTRVLVSSQPVLPDTVQPLTLPAAVTTWQAGPGRVVIDGLTWDQPWEGPANPRRFAQALLANLGVAFVTPAATPAVESIPLRQFQLVGESPYLERGAERILARSNAHLRADFTSVRAGRYAVQVNASGTPFEGEYPRLRVLVNDREVDVLHAGAEDKPLATGPLDLAAGDHTVSVIFDNDASGPNEDRNAEITRVGFIAP